MHNSLEQQVLILHQAGYSIRAIANHLGIDKSKVQRIIGKIHKSTIDTVNDTPLDTQGETCDTGYASLTDTLAERRLDTLHDTAPIAIRQPNNKTNTNNTPQGKYSLGGLGLLTRQIGILKEDINDFVLDTTELYDGYVTIPYLSYQAYLRRVRRLTQSIILLTDQLGEDYRLLLVTQVLLAIKDVIEEDFAGVLDHSQPEAQDFSLPKRDTRYWMEVLKVDFLQHSN